MHVSVRLFAHLRAIVGTDELVCELPTGATARTAWDDLAAKFPELTEHREAVSTAVNAEYARMDHLLADGDEIAFLPPRFRRMLTLVPIVT